MSGTTPAIEAAVVVLPGSFNPGLFSPWWFSGQGLIPQTEAETAQNVLTSTEYSRFDTTWLSLEVISERLTFTTLQAPYFNPLRDLAESVLNLLPHTPVSAIGLNRTAHFQLESEEVWHSLGHRLAPKESLWDNILNEPGTLRLMIQAQRDDSRPGVINVTVEPSAKIEHGYFVEVNDHFARPSELDSPAGAGWAVEVLSECWKQHQDRVDKIRAALWDFATKGGELN